MKGKFIKTGLFGIILICANYISCSAQQIDSIVFRYDYKWYETRFAINTEDRFLCQRIDKKTIDDPRQINKFMKIIDRLRIAEDGFHDYRIMIVLHYHTGEIRKMFYSYLMHTGYLYDNGIMKSGDRRLHRFFDKLLYKNWTHFVPPVPKE